VSDTSQFELNAELQPAETVCFCRRVTAQQRVKGTALILAIVGAFLIYVIVANDLGAQGALILFLLVPLYFIRRAFNVTGEVIITDRRLLYKFKNQPSTGIALGGIVVAQLINYWKSAHRSGAHSAYYRLTLSDQSVHRVFVLGDYETFADCLPTNVKVYKTQKDVKGGRFLATAFVVGLIAGMVVGIGVGVFVLTGLIGTFDGVTDTEFWSIVIVVFLLFGGLIFGGYVGIFMGISFAYRYLKMSLSLVEAKELATFALALDFGAISVAARLNLKSLVRHLERTLSHAYRQPVRLP
jgi:hypothetical protein